MEIILTSIRLCMKILLLPVFIVTLITFIPVIIIAAILRNTEAYVYRILYDARVFSSADVIWRIIQKENPGDINGCMLLDGELSIDKFTKLINAILLKAKHESGESIYWQVTKYIVPGYINNYWIEEEAFNLHEHVRQLNTEPIISEKGLQEILRKGSTHENPKKSPWELILIPYLENGSRKTVLHFRISHALTDGASLVYFLLYRLTESEHSIDQSQLSLPRYLQMKRLVLFLKALWALPLVAIENLIMKKETNAFDNVRLTGDKHVCWSKPLDIKPIKDIKNKLGTTVNDVILGCCSKSFNDVFYEFNKYCPKQLCISVPFNMRFHIDEAKDFKNKFNGLCIKLPTYQTNLKSSINEMNRRMNEIKLTCQPFAIYMIWNTLTYCMIPDVFSHSFIMNCLQNISVVTSSVVGPQHKIRICGHPVDSIIQWAPAVPTKSVSISFLSYNNKLRIGIVTDGALFVNAEKLIEIFERNIISIGDMSERL